MKIFVDGEEVDLDIPAGTVRQAGDRLLVTTPEGTHSAMAVRKGDEILISFRGRQYAVTQQKTRVRAASPAGSGEIRAPMPGQIVDLRIAVGDEVSKGQVLVVLEAMKTQQPFAAPFEGIVASLPVTVGQLVAEGTVLVTVKARTQGEAQS